MTAIRWWNRLKVMKRFLSEWIRVGLSEHCSVLWGFPTGASVTDVPWWKDSLSTKGLLLKRNRNMMKRFGNVRKSQSRNSHCIRHVFRSESMSTAVWTVGFWLEGHSFILKYRGGCFEAKGQLFSINNFWTFLNNIIWPKIVDTSFTSSGLLACFPPQVGTWLLGFVRFSHHSVSYVLHQCW